MYEVLRGSRNGWENVPNHEHMEFFPACSSADLLSGLSLWPVPYIVVNEETGEIEYEVKA